MTSSFHINMQHHGLCETPNGIFGWRWHSLVATSTATSGFVGALHVQCCTFNCTTQVQATTRPWISMVECGAFPSGTQHCCGRRCSKRTMRTVKMDPASRVVPSFVTFIWLKAELYLGQSFMWLPLDQRCQNPHVTH